MKHRAALSSLLLTLALRCAPSDAEANPRVAEARYLSLGDSFTIGTGSSAAQAFPSRLAARWRHRGARR